MSLDMRHKMRKTRDERRETRDVVHRPSSIVHRKYRGFTIAELLLVLAISGILLAAVAVAFNASIINYKENEDIFKTINNARQALFRITSQLRTAGYQVSPELFVAVDPNEPSNRCSFYTATGDNLTYEYRDASDPVYPNTLLLIDNSNDKKYVLCDHVTSAAFTKTPILKPDGWDCKSVQISMTVQSGNMQRTLSSAVVIRRNLN